jgi:hypothetical protein
VDIVWESLEFSVDAFGQKGSASRSARAKERLFLCSHNSPRDERFRIQRAARWLQRFPLIHSDHHNNKSDSAKENGA